MTKLINIKDKIRILFLLLSSTFSEWKKEIWKHELDERYCCDGNMCGCGAMTIRELYAKQNQITKDYFTEDEIPF